MNKTLIWSLKKFFSLSFGKIRTELPYSSSDECLRSLYSSFTSNIDSSILETHFSDHQEREYVLDFIACLISPLCKGRKIQPCVRPGLIRVKQTINRYSNSRLKRLMADKNFARVFLLFSKSGKGDQFISSDNTMGRFPWEYIQAA